jgi:hypothetical protein
MDYKPFSIEDSLYSTFTITNTTTTTNSPKLSENFSTYGYTDTTGMKNVSVDKINENQVIPLSQMSKEYIANITAAEKNYMDMCGNIAKLSRNLTTFAPTVQKYYDEKSDLAKKNKLIDVRSEDAEIMMVQQNYLYILGTITLAIVLVGSIVIAKN